MNSRHSIPIEARNTARRSGHPKIREASFDDYYQIAALESRYGFVANRYDEWRHLWVNNPVYHELRKDWPIGWVLEDENKKIVGSLGNIPFLYEFQGRKIISSSARHWVVEPPYRSYSIFLLDCYYGQTGVQLCVEVGVHFETLDSQSEFHALPVPAGDWDQSVFWITNYNGFARGSLAMKALPLANALSYPLSFALFCKDRFRKNPLDRADHQVAVKPCSDFDDRFDVFWEALKAKRSQVLLATRSREVLTWHFRNSMLNNATWVLTITEGSRLVAYSIFCRHDNPKFGLKRVRLVDFQTIDGDATLLQPMLSWAFKRCQKEGIHMLDVMGLSAQKRDVILKLSPYRRRLPGWSCFYKTRDKKLAVSLENREVWDPCAFDGDATLGWGDALVAG
jgi:hypothetical protein